MLKKTVTYKDPFTQETRTEDVYFNLTRAEVMELELRENLQGGLAAKLQTIVDSNDGRLIMDNFRYIIGWAYGERTAEGRFVKSPQAQQAFFASEAYSQIFEEIVTDANKASAFIQAILPTDLDRAPGAPANGPTAPQDYRPSAREIAERQRQQGFHNVQEPQQPVGTPPVPPPPSSNVFDRPAHESGPGYQGQ